MKIAESIGDALFKQADYFVFQTNAAKEYYPKSVQKKAVVIPNPIKPLNRTMPREGNIEKKIVCVARLDLYQKRQDILIDAYKNIAQNFPDYRLVLYGDGEDYDETILRQKASGCPQIIFAGPCKNLVEDIQNATLAVLSSDFEGIPNALLEYMSLGIPSISTDCSPGGAAMIITNGINGLLVPRSNPHKLSDAIAYMLQNPQEAENMGHNGTTVNERFSEIKISQRWNEVLSTLKNN